MTPGPLIDEAVERYLRIGLRLGRHLDGLVDAYYGPPNLRDRAEREPPRPLAGLADDIGQLIADLDSPLDAGGSASDVTRRAWLRGQLVGLDTTARKLAGEPIGYADEVERCYGVRPSPVPEDDLAEAHRLLDAVVPGSGDLAERLPAWRDTHIVPTDRLPSVLRSLAEDLRERTDRQFGLPDDEHIDWELVTDQPWSGFNYYLGDLQSRVAINIDLPVHTMSLPHLVAHEAFPGHHTEHCRKEVGLVRGRRHLEETIFLVGTPQCLLAEGLADLGIEVLVGLDYEGEMADHFTDGLRYDVAIIAAVRQAGRALGGVRGNAALMLHEEAVPTDEVVEYLMRWSLQPRERAEKAVQFLTDPTWRAYISCYVEGLPLCRDFVAGDPTRFERLLTEQLLPSDLMS